MNVIVIGAGHAGIEAAYAAAKMGAQVLLLTMQLESIAQMSCNPSIGGLAKGHLVKEIDALAGVMPRAADYTGIHFKILNRGKGPAVRASRTQNDKAMYRNFMKNFLEKAANIKILQGIVTRIVTKKNRVHGVELITGETIDADAVIVASGTFLNGRIFIGETSYAAGRANEMPASHLARNLKELGFATLRLKTGTPMRLHADSIDWSRFTPQPGDEPPIPFSLFTRRRPRNRVLCHLGHTTPEVKRLVLENLQLSPLYAGRIKGIGPRYCPSIEDKMVKFPDKETHQFFLEPEGLNTKEIYVNGLSTSMPIHIQQKILQAIPGLNQAMIVRPAYAIEYDAIMPTQLLHSLESRAVKNLFFAGQINGTSGYEEAAGQGIVAGINTVLGLKGERPFIPGRNQAYMGVLIDDLVCRGVDEPYRLFTSRAEYRLQLREDNAFERLGQYALQFGLISSREYGQQMKKLQERKNAIRKLQQTKLQLQGGSISAYQLLKRPENDLNALQKKFSLFRGRKFSQGDISYIEAEVKYSGYIEIQKREVEKSRQVDSILLPQNIDYSRIPGLSTEIRQKLNRTRPTTIGEAKKIAGMTPAAINALSIYLTLLANHARIQEKDKRS